jgi:hypothetical protein
MPQDVLDGVVDVAGRGRAGGGDGEDDGECGRDLGSPGTVISF